MYSHKCFISVHMERGIPPVVPHSGWFNRHTGLDDNPTLTMCMRKLRCVCPAGDGSVLLQTTNCDQISSMIHGGDESNQVRCFYFLTGLPVCKIRTFVLTVKEFFVPFWTGLNRAVPLLTELLFATNNRLKNNLNFCCIVRTIYT